MPSRLRVLFIGRSPHDLPLKPQVAAKWDALAEVLDIRVVGTRGMVEAYDARFHLSDASSRLPGARFYASLPVRARRHVRAFKPDAIIAQSPYEAAMIRLGWPLRRPPVPVVAEVHGDWRTASRFYGSRGRRLVSRPADWVAEIGLRSAAGVRAVGPRMSELVEAVTGQPPLEEFPTWFDAAQFFSSPPVPLPQSPVAVWIGVLERYKNPHLLAAAWPMVVEGIPAARLRVIGRGPLQPVIEGLVSRHSESVSHMQWVSSATIARELDQASCLVLSSRSEGLPRVGIEAFARGRCIVGTAVDGNQDLVEDGVNGRLVAPDDPSALAAALTEVLGDVGRASVLGAGARRSAERFRRSPDQYASQVLRLVERAFAQAPAS